MTIFDVLNGNKTTASIGGCLVTLEWFNAKKNADCKMSLSACRKKIASLLLCIDVG